MSRFQIGVMSDSFRLSPREGVRKSKEVGADGIQIYASSGEVSPEQMDAAARADFRAFCDDLDLEISALCADLGGHGFQIPADNVWKVERSRKIVDLAVDLGADVVTTHIGCVPDEAADPTYQIMLKACRELGDYADERSITFAVETGPETAARLTAFLDDVDSAGIGANYDPANLVMVTGDDPVQGVYALRNHIVHTHAKDGVQYKPCDPVKIYDAFARGGIEGLNFGDYFDEVPLGQGKVDFDAYLAALADIDFHGFLTIEREVGKNPEKDIRTAVEFLREKIKRFQ